MVPMPPEAMTLARSQGDHLAQGVEVRALQPAIAADVGEDDVWHALARRRVGATSSAADRRSARCQPCVATMPSRASSPTAMASPNAATAAGTSSGFDMAAEPITMRSMPSHAHAVQRGEVAQAPAELQIHGDRGPDALDHRLVLADAIARAVEVDDVDPRRALVLPAPGGIDRVGVELTVSRSKSPSIELDGPATANIDCGIDDHVAFLLRSDPGSTVSATGRSGFALVRIAGRHPGCADASAPSGNERQAVVAALFGVELKAPDIVLRHDAWEAHAVVGFGRDFGSFVRVHDVGVDEIEVGGVETRERRARPELGQVPPICGTLWSFGRARPRPRSRPRPVVGPSSWAPNRSCMPRQTPSTGVPALAASVTASARPLCAEAVPWPRRRCRRRGGRPGRPAGPVPDRW